MKIDAITDAVIDQVLEHYITCALWASIDDDGDPFDRNYEAGDIHKEAVKRMRQEVEDFVREQKDLINLLPDSYGLDQLGHDFFLTRNGHGAGFWDRGLGPVGDALTEACKACGSQDLYLGDDEFLWVA